MIFSKLFKAKWQHKDSNVRITAINEELSAADKDQKAILISLSKTDKNELVRRAALIKLADFSAWLDAKNNNDNKKVQSFAQQQVEKILFGQHAITLSSEEKQHYLKQCTTSQGLETWLNIETDPTLIIALFEKINKPQLALSVFEQKSAVEVQRYLITVFDKIELLEKALKKSTHQEINDLINNKVANIVAQNEKPEKLKKKIKLTLAKLLALKDITDFSIVLTKRPLIEQEWQNFQQENSCLTAQEQTEYFNKYQAISDQLTKVFAEKEEQHQQQLIEIKLAQEKKSARDSFEQAIKELSKEIATSIFEQNTIDENKFETLLAQLNKKIDESVLNEKEKQEYQNKVEQQKQTLTKLPEIAQSVTEATHLISKISQLALPTTLDELNERQPIYNDWLKQWQVIENLSAGYLPDSITIAVKEIRGNWRQGLAPLLAEQKLSLTQIQKRLSEFNRLISSGKYNASFGVYKRIEKLYQQLNAQQLPKIQRDFDTASEKIKELSDWEHYIATPRKQELLLEVNAIVETPLDNPNEQAEKVKQYRKTWNSLGHAEDDVEKSLNEAFNLACEQAFAPCRLFYNEQEKMREQHLVTREKLIAQAQVLAETLTEDENSRDWKSFDGQLNKIQQLWSDAGEVDRAKYRALHQQFTSILQPVKNAIKAFHQDNISQKQLLISKAEKALADDDVFSAINLVKGLQSDWRNVGYCGPRDENKLWQTFRKINDNVFAKRDQVKEAEKSQQLTLQTQFETELATLRLQDQSDAKSLQAVKESAQQLLRSVFEQKPVIKSIGHAVDGFVKEIDGKIADYQQQQQTKNWNNVFECLTLIASGDINADNFSAHDLFEKITIAWQKKIQDVLKNSTEVNRDIKTLELEILAGIESPTELKQQRMQVQVGLMQQQMLAGTAVNLEKSLFDWLLLGTITKQDLPLLLRVKPIYCR